MLGLDQIHDGFLITRQGFTVDLFLAILKLAELFGCCGNFRMEGPWLSSSDRAALCSVHDEG